MRHLTLACDHGLSPGELIQMHDDEDLQALRGDPAFDALMAKRSAETDAVIVTH